MLELGPFWDTSSLSMFIPIWIVMGVSDVLLATSVYSWTVVPVEQRNMYMAALERASVDGISGILKGFLGIGGEGHKI